MNHTNSPYIQPEIMKAADIFSNIGAKMQALYEPTFYERMLEAPVVRKLMIGMSLISALCFGKVALEKIDRDQFADKNYPQVTQMIRQGNEMTKPARVETTHFISQPLPLAETIASKKEISAKTHAMRSTASSITTSERRPFLSSAVSLKFKMNTDSVVNRTIQNVKSLFKPTI